LLVPPFNAKFALLSISHLLIFGFVFDMGKKVGFVELLEQTILSVKKVGIDQTINTLRRCQESYVDTEKAVLAIIVNQASSVFKISREEIYTGTSRGYRSIVLGCCGLQMKEHLKCSDTYVSDHFGKHISNMQGYMEKASSLDPKIKFESEIIEKYMVMEDAIRKQIESEIPNHIS